ncbi:hypothetical protein MYCTH_2126672 [Thermothelomyces thermophilus ATCC 42464]|uniref:Uncharacterized protein n=1 Tax=Thermothelomyces thermophilus (strain ATCC 42464 / BCRC 31852 / DSM 1799) TaxID=573729 RepID=G2QE88_THET4|nr:uncharacterized protein MYCTH_2126672 [Thermothelomyces thermophilus ATCC 42464]AEO57671.1 hypothetical protein MYCTH_2126672 [Thermothelomyces thermophilus ATCC 42464]
MAPQQGLTGMEGVRNVLLYRVEMDGDPIPTIPDRFTQALPVKLPASRPKYSIDDTRYHHVGIPVLLHEAGARVLDSAQYNVKRPDIEGEEEASALPVVFGVPYESGGFLPYWALRCLHMAPAIWQYHDPAGYETSVQRIVEQMPSECISFTSGQASKQASKHLHKRGTNFNLNPIEIEQRKRAFRIAYMLDKDLCLRSGRPPAQDDNFRPNIMSFLEIWAAVYDTVSVRPNIISFLEIWAAVCDTVSGIAAIISLIPLARPSFARLRAYFRREPVPAQTQQEPEPAYINQTSR